MATVDEATGPRPAERGTRRPGGRRARRGGPAALLAAALATVLAAGCTSGGGPADDSRGSTPPPGRTATADPTPSTAPSPTAAAGQVLAVKIDNVRAARPQTGLDAADVVYVEQVEGGLSRLMAVFATKLPKTVGPVRSARESDLELLRQFDRPVLAFSGAQGKLLPLIDREPLEAVTPEDTDGVYFRGRDKASPHNLYLRPGRLLDEAPGAAALTTGFRHGPAPAGGNPAKERTVRFPSARFTFTWSARAKGWELTTDGTPTRVTDGRRLAPATVVVQYVKIRRSAYHDSLGNRTPYTETVGTGRAEVLRDGRSYPARWRRPAATDGTDFTAPDGTPLPFAQGQVWVVLAAAR
ncbi:MULTISPECIES: DUF3048 domain-containing protein [unclassified Streptomyces]|uniref:DUF3048 domain-containing protein n=1 Tax=unclassified Streptomyces TaxID=2593676 RepID=UPI0037F41BF6